MISNFPRRECALFFSAVRLLTRFPAPHSVDHSAEPLDAATRYYPLVGVVIGVIGGTVYWVAALVLEPVIAVLLSTAVTALCTGAFHEDGLADMFDGIGGGYTRERALEIMRDSRIGSFGALALIIVLATKVATLASMSVDLAFMTIICGHTVSRTSSVLTIATSRYARDGDVNAYAASSISSIGLTIAILTGVAALVALAWLDAASTAVGALIGATLGHLGIRCFYQRRIGGYTGDCLGATQQITEVGTYVGIITVVALA